MHLYVERFAQPLVALLGGAEDPDLHPLVHRHVGLHARAVVHQLARPQVERHLPGARSGLDRRGSLGLELPQGVHLEQVVQEVLHRLRRHRLELAIQVQGGRRRSPGGVVLLDQAPDRSVHAIRTDVLAQGVQREGAPAAGEVRIERP